jgi:hypothetical protein
MIAQTLTNKLHKFPALTPSRDFLSSLFLLLALLLTSWVDIDVGGVAMVQRSFTQVDYELVINKEIRKYKSNRWL